MKKDKIKKINVKKYPYLIVFNSTRCDLKISKRNEIRLREIGKEIIKLYKEQEELFKKRKWKKK